MGGNEEKVAPELEPPESHAPVDKANGISTASKKGWMFCLERGEEAPVKLLAGGTRGQTNANVSGGTATTTTTTQDKEWPPTKEDSPLLTEAEGWSYGAPSLTDWSVSSTEGHLLTVTFLPTVEANLEYTKSSLPRDWAGRATAPCCTTCAATASGSGASRRGNAASSCCGGGGAQEFQRRVYTTRHVEQVHVLDHLVDIDGMMGPYRAVQVHLVALTKLSDMPHHHPQQQKQLSKKVLAALEHLRQVKQPPDTFVSKQRDTLPPPPWAPSTPIHLKTDIPTNASRHDAEKINTFVKEQAAAAAAAARTSPSRPGPRGYTLNDTLSDMTPESQLQPTYGPIITFAVLAEAPNEENSSSRMLRDSPPLVWKVELPPDPNMAVETLTVLDGTLDLLPNNVATPDNSGNGTDDETDCELPTNVFINGYQSWSYAGSVKRGEAQLTSAMPNYLSKAFNYGGTVPPKATTYKTVPYPLTSINAIFHDEPHVYDPHTMDDDDPILPDDPIRPEAEQTHDYSTMPEPTTRERIYREARGQGDKEDYCDPLGVAFYKSDFFTCVTSTGKVASNDNDNGEDLLDELGGPALMLGWLSQKHAFGVVTLDADLREVAMHCSYHGKVATHGLETDWAYCQIMAPQCYDEEPMAHYLDAVAGHNDAKPMQNGPILTGWCSWYHYYENIEETTLTENFSRLSNLKAKISSNVAIIDDGYITAWGDWNSMKKKQFPRGELGMKALAENIRSNGMKPGLWLAPFACDKKSQIAKLHPDWIIKNDAGRFANSSNCGKFFYGLDATNPAVRQHAYEAIKRAVDEWGYEVLKLDFLYAACLDGNGKYDLNLSRAEAMHLALQTVREAAGPDTFIIGCGCPLGTAVGYVDAMRISADTGPTWYPAFPLPWWDHSTLPSLRAMIRNSCTRASLGHRWWHNDPDCILLGESTDLTDEEVVSAATIVALTGGMFLLSDDLSKLSKGRLRVGTKIYPVTGATAVALDLHACKDRGGLPSLLRLWCTDQVVIQSADTGSSTLPDEVLDDADGISMDQNAQATALARLAAFDPSKPLPNPAARVRNCIQVVAGLGTWSVVSMSNWLDVPSVVSTLISALLPPTTLHQVDTEQTPTNGTPANHTPTPSMDEEVTQKETKLGYHVFAFWSSKYIWVPELMAEEKRTLSKKLQPHESEIFHIKAVSLDRPQYIGSDLHFTCGYEVRKFHVKDNQQVDVYLKNDLKRAGYVFLFVPGCDNPLDLHVNGEPAQVDLIAKTPISHNQTTAGYLGRIVRIWIVVHGTSSENDGKISLRF